jgi:multidrug resistance efflux pump
VNVKDNAAVKKGDVLFVVDPSRYQIALGQAQAAHAQAQAAQEQGKANLLAAITAVRQLQRETERDNALKDLVAVEDAETRRANLEKAQAAVTAAQASIAAATANIAATQSAVDLAQLNLERTRVRSPMDGRVSDRTVRLGDYVTAGRPVLAVLDTDSFRIDGYFEETRLRHIEVGQPVEIHLMGENRILHGHVQSIAVGIEDRYRTEGSSLLPNVNPTFDWVRLAQRIPVRISLDAVPADVHLIAGRSVTVNVIGNTTGNSIRNATDNDVRQSVGRQGRSS